MLTSPIVFGQEDADLESDCDGRFDDQWVIVQHSLCIIVNVRTLDPVAGVVQTGGSDITGGALERVSLKLDLVPVPDVDLMGQLLQNANKRGPLGLRQHQLVKLFASQVGYGFLRVNNFINV